MTDILQTTFECIFLNDNYFISTQVAQNFASTHITTLFVYAPQCFETLCYLLKSKLELKFDLKHYWPIDPNRGKYLLRMG